MFHKTADARQPSLACKFLHSFGWVRHAAGLSLLLAATVASGCAASSDNPEDFKIELSGAAWIVDTHGTIQASGTPVNLVQDLGASQQNPTFWGSLVLKPGRKHRIVVEGMPFSVDGHSVVSRTILYHGQTFTVNESLRSSADLHYVFGGYQYDFLSGPMGHLGVSVGGAYLATTGSITSLTLGTTATKSETVGLPLAGVELRLFPIPHHKIITIQGDVRGMDVGSYGEYLEDSGSGGITLGPVTLLGGYRAVHVDLHASSGGTRSGVDARLSGPVFTAQWRW